MFCKYCGSEVNGNFCSNCGKSVNDVIENKNEGSAFGYGVLGFFCPIVGFILFLVYLNNKKKVSRASLIGSVIGILVKVFLIILLLFVFSYGINGAIDCYDTCGSSFEYSNGQCYCTNDYIDTF